MKRGAWFSALVLITLQSIFAQSLPVGYIPLYNRSDWNTSGVNVNNPPALTDIVVDVDVELATGLTLREVFDNALDEARPPSPQTVLIAFGNGTYYLDAANGFTEPYEITDVSNVIFQGMGSGTVLVNALLQETPVYDYYLSAFKIYGIAGPSLPKNLAPSSTTQKKSKIFAVENTTGLSNNDWIHIHIENFHKSNHVGNVEGTGWAEIGQISNIDAINGNNITIEDEANIDYLQNYGTVDGVEINTVVKEFTPVSGIGFENFVIKTAPVPFPRGSLTASEGYFFDFEYATNCWVRGVEMVKPGRSHIRLSKSARVEVSGCYFNDARKHGEGGGGEGYGVNMLNSTSQCFIENNIFRRLRHSIVFQAGANGNVASYNYSREGYWNHSWAGWDPREIVFHGTYPFSNLVEQNMTRQMGPDDWNGKNGPFNAIVRNHIRESNDGGYLRNAALHVTNASDLSLLGNVIYDDTKYRNNPPYSLTVDLYGWDKSSTQRTHTESNWLVWLNYLMGDISYVYSSQPAFAAGYTWPAIGPRTDTVSPLNVIPANPRFHGSNIKTYNAIPTPNPTPTPKIWVKNAFFGGVVEVDNDSEISGQEEHNWPPGSQHTIEAINQDWPQANNFFRKFTKWIDPRGVNFSNQTLTLTTPSIDGSYTADFDTRLDIDLNKILMNGGMGGSIKLNDTLLTNLPHSGQHFFTNFLTLEVEEFTELVNGVSVDYSLSHWSNESTSNPYTLEATEHVDLTAYIKGYKVADSENATVGNNSPKIATHPSNDNLHLVYIDNGKLYYSNSLDGGSNWTKDVYLDGASSEYNCQYPGVGVDGNGNVHIVYEREYDDGSIKDYTVQYIEIDYFTETGVNRTEIGGFADNAGGYQFSTIPSICVRYYGDVYVAWRRSYNNIGTPDGKLVVRHKDVLGNWSTHKDVPNTDLDCVSPTLSYGDIAGSGFLHIFWVDTQSDRVYYANPTSQWNWGTSANLTSGISTISDFKNTSVHQCIGSYPDNIYLVWEGIEEFAGETKTSRPTKSVRDEENIKAEEKQSFSMGCPPATPDNPIIYFQEHDGSGWTGQTIFRINNTCDRKPVVTSWETASGRQAMIAYENLEGRVATILRNENGQWASPTQITSNGTNPSLTNAGDSEPNLIYTRYSTNPHEIRFENNLLPPPFAPGATNPSVTALPHSRIVRINLETDLLGGSGLGIKGDVVIEIGDLEILTNQGAQKVSPQYNDSLITPSNIFEYNNILLSEVNTLKIPVSLKAFGLSYQENRDSTFLPVLSLKLHDAVTHNMLKNIKFYTTDIFGNNTNYLEQDTIEVDLNNISSTTLYFRGEVFLKDNTWKADMAEVFDLRNIQVDTLRKGSLPTADDKLPNVFALYQNYPNPFNPSTTIRFDLPKNVKVKIKIYDIQGRLVDILVNKSMKAGTHEMTWNGRSRAGYRVASGLYFYRIQAGNFTRVKKMLIVK